MLEVRTWRFRGYELANLIDLMNLGSLHSISLLRESVSHFIDEGDGLRSEREGVRLLLSLATHAGGYKMMVGAHNTVECQMNVGGCIVFFRYGRCRYMLYC